MAAPANSTRSTPLGNKLRNGHVTKIAFGIDPDVSFWEIEGGAPPIDGGDAIDITTMHNTEWTQMAPRTLKTLGEFSLTVAYDPDAWNELGITSGSLINNNGSITVEFPDGSDLDFYGYMKSFEPGGLTRGELPTATIGIVPTNLDDVNDLEAAPVLTEVAGT